MLYWLHNDGVFFEDEDKIAIYAGFEPGRPNVSSGLHIEFLIDKEP